MAPVSPRRKRRPSQLRRGLGLQLLRLLLMREGWLHRSPGRLLSEWKTSYLCGWRRTAHRCLWHRDATQGRRRTWPLRGRHGGGRRRQRAPSRGSCKAAEHRGNAGHREPMRRIRLPRRRQSCSPTSRHRVHALRRDETELAHRGRLCATQAWTRTCVGCSHGLGGRWRYNLWRRRIAPAKALRQTRLRRQEPPQRALVVTVWRGAGM